PQRLLSLFVDDATPEVVAKKLLDQRGRIAVSSEEGTIFEVMRGRYSEGRANLEVFLTGHSGRDYIVDRIGREGGVLVKPALSMVLAVQPAVIAGLGRSPE